MKKILLGIFLVTTFISKSQYYQFQKTTGSYTNITGGTVILNNNWSDTLVSFKNPFYFRFFTTNINNGATDSIQVTDYGSLYFNNINNGFFDVFGVDLKSRGDGKSPISYVIEGVSPNRITKIQFMNVGFNSDAPALTDSMNFQVWIYETSYILEFRYGPNSVKEASYTGEKGAYVDIADPLGTGSNFIAVEKDPANPTLRTTNLSMLGTLTGTPANGTIYRFTPSPFHTGINNERELNISLVENKLILPSTLEYRNINIYDIHGRLLESRGMNEEVSITGLPHGLYIIMVDTKDGMISKKMLL